MSKPSVSLTLKVAIESIRTYEATMKDNTRYKDASEIRAGVYHEVIPKNNAQDMGNAKEKKKEDYYTFNKECRRYHGLHHFEDYCLTET